MTNKDYSFDGLKEYLRDYCTASALAEAMGCSKPTAYARIRALAASGVELESTLVREGRTGPPANAYRLNASERRKLVSAERRRAKASAVSSARNVSS